MNDENLREPQADNSPAEPDSTAASGPRRVIKIGSQRQQDSIDQPVMESLPAQDIAETETLPEPAAAAGEDVPAVKAASFPPPRVTRIPADLQREIEEALGDLPIDQLLGGSSAGLSKGPEPELDQQYRATVVKISRDDVFFSLPGNYEGAASLRQFDEVPEPGTPMEVVVTRFNTEEGLYDLNIPGKSIAVADWSDLDEGVTVEARITGHNSGGLECEVNGIRGFIPISQIALFRVEDLAEFVDQKFSCVVTEANPSRGNLVLSRRAVLEREQAVEKERLMQSLEAGQVREGVVRNIRDFGAFVDLGGVDGLVHISKLSWDRVTHPSDVLEEGQRVQVKIEKIDEATGKISLSYRDLLDHPWEQAAEKYHENDIVTGTVSRIADFGAFVKLEAGVEGLVHISELAHHRVQRVDTIVSEGQEVQVKILSVDPDSQRMSLSLKAVQGPPSRDDTASKDDGEEEQPRARATKPHRGPLKGGTNRPTGGEQFGLQW